MLLNKIKTTILLSLLTGAFILMGNLLGGSIGIKIAFLISIFININLYFFSEKIALKAYGAQPLDPVKFSIIHKTVEELASTMNLPKPKLWIISASYPNAFATGRNPKNSSIALTTTIIDLLDSEELRGVLAHELSHIQNRDILIATMAATIATAISYASSMIRNMLFWRSFGYSSNNRHNNNYFGLLISAMVMPIVAVILQLAISRSREYLADESGAHASKQPLALASALRKLELHSIQERSHHTAPTAFSSLFIVNPMFGKKVTTLFSSHPPTKKRIERLESFYKKHY